MSLSLAVEERRFRLAEAFTIARGARTEARVVEARVSDTQGRLGRGECVPYARYGETVEGVIAAIESMGTVVARGLGRDELQGLLPAGAARNALDCALWDLEAKRAGRPVWALAGLDAPGPVLTVYTLSLGPPEAMRRAAETHAHRPVLKVKLGGGPEDLARLEAVRAGAPAARLVLDANEGWDLAAYGAIAPRLADLGVEMVEQPMPAGDDEALRGAPRPVTLCADESCHDRSSLPGLAGKYDMVNIKLDKTGGLTEALALRQAAVAAGLSVMVGCMIGSSLAMAPALLVAQGAAVVDLDAPLLLAEDREPAMLFDSAGIHPAPPALWG